MALDGLIHVEGPRGLRSIPMAEFALGFMTTALALDEVLTGVTLRRWPPGHGYAFLEFARRLGDFAIVAVAALIELDEANSVKRAAVALAGAGSVQLRLPAVEQTLNGQRPHRDLFAAAAARATEIEAIVDVHASADYRRHLANVLVARALATAAGRAQQRSGQAA
jgi:carbon-monoxide dehydrogenase medium subunit